MFEYIDKIEGRVLALKNTAQITVKEHAQIEDLIKERIAEWGRIRIFVRIKHYPAFSSAEALYEDLRMIKLHSDHIDRMVVVGDRSWKGTWVGLFGLFSGLKTDYFELDRIEAAWQWISED